jgi:diguanylate cyclase (GGDEF)-like protein
VPDQQPSVAFDHAPPKDESLLKRLALCADLPSPVGIAMRILELGRDPDASLADVAKVIGMDTALSAKLLRLANSPLYARQRRPENVRQAINLLGLDGTLTLALSFSLIKNLRPSGGAGFDLDAFWRRSLTIATCAQLLAERLSVAHKEDLFLAGLLHDIGLLALAQVRTDDCGEADDGHAAIGDWLLERWRIPERLRSLVHGSHCLLAGAEEGPAIDLPAGVLSIGAQVAGLWCEPGPAASLPWLIERAHRLIGLEGEAFIDTLDRARTGVVEAARLFEIEPQDALQLEALITEARELTMLRHIKTMRESARLEHATELLEARTRRLEEETRRDALTGLFNRAHLQHVLQEELGAANGSDCPLGVAFIDLDGFKGKNDRHGHLAGDQILRNAARTLTGCTRENDLAFRYGGDEFVVLLPGSGGEGALASCARILEALRQMHRFSGGGDELAVTASIGVAIHGQPVRFTHAEAILAAADEALYAAKRLGRDRLVLYGAGHD